MYETEMWNRASFLTRLVASSVRISEAAGATIKNVLAGGDLKIIDKSIEGEPADPQTEADRRAQYLIVKSLTEKFGNINIIGEERNGVVQIRIVEELAHMKAQIENLGLLSLKKRSAKLTVILDSAHTALHHVKIASQRLTLSWEPFLDVTSECNGVEKNFSIDVLRLEEGLSSDLKLIKPDEVVVWVDPLDGTGEVALAVKNKNAALLEQVTVLIGVAFRGRPVAGIIHQPYYNETGRTIFAIQGCGIHGISPAPAQPKRVVVTTRSHLSKSVTDALDALKEKGLVDVVEKFGGAGYKVLKVLEGSAAYVFASPGCKKWDTCAVEAVLAAAGGHLTDISGRLLCYESTVQRNNTGGVLASAPWVNHQEYISSIPKALKDQLPEIAAKS